MLYPAGGMALLIGIEIARERRGERGEGRVSRGEGRGGERERGEEIGERRGGREVARTNCSFISSF